MKALKEKSKTLYYVVSALKHLWSAQHYTIKMFFVLICGTCSVIHFFIRQKIFRNHLPNFSVVDDGILFRGGQPTEEGVSQLVDKGVKTLVILRTDFDDDYYEKFINTLRVIHIPFNPFRPKEKILVDFLKVMQERAYHPVYVHCFHGADRTGTLVAAYRVVIQGWAKEDAIAEMKRFGLHWWHRNLIKYINDLNVKALQDELGVCPPACGHEGRGSDTPASAQS
ncbi:MAG: tyrosine-protein phosphatase [Simkaniaceae bacterium]|nr:tyrosine-protein phosphatase [Simkaniaceae bacterium]